VEEAVGGSEAVAELPRELFRSTGAGTRGKALPLHAIEASAAPRFETGIAELDRVLGGGLVPGSVVLLGGEPGVGKSTLALQLAGRVQAGRSAVLYVTGEESVEQLRLRAQRLRDVPGEVLVLAETRVEALVEPWREARPDLVVIDSIQALHSDRVESAPGSVAQVRESAALLAGTAKANAAALVLIGHVTKEGVLAGPRVLEHLVDSVLTLEGDRSHAYRLLRASKNRFGSTREVGVFTMQEAGLVGVENPSELFLSERHVAAAGSCVVPLVEGSRPMLIEIQALVAPAGYGTARRTSIGIDDGRVALLLAVLDRYTDVDLVSRDVYVNVTGGVRITEPAADLALALALASSRVNVALPADVAACGEVGLGGEVRRVGRLDLRVREAARLGL
jgi:DNA repair protein RadA/Sms